MAKDRFHYAVRNALEKDGWIITADPYEVSVGDVDFEIDLAAQMLAAQRAGEKISVEIKSFIGGSNVSEFHTADTKKLTNANKSRLFLPVSS